MRMIVPALTLAMMLGLVPTPPAVAQNLPSDVEEHLGIPPNAANPDRGGRYRNPPSDLGAASPAAGLSRLRLL